MLKVTVSDKVFIIDKNNLKPNTLLYNICNNENFPESNLIFDNNPIIFEKIILKMINNYKINFDTFIITMQYIFKKSSLNFEEFEDNIYMMNNEIEFFGYTSPFKPNLNIDYYYISAHYLMIKRIYIELYEEIQYSIFRQIDFNKEEIVLVLYFTNFISNDYFLNKNAVLKYINDKFPNCIVKSEKLGYNVSKDSLYMKTRGILPGMIRQDNLKKFRDTENLNYCSIREIISKYTGDYYEPDIYFNEFIKNKEKLYTTKEIELYKRSDDCIDLDKLSDIDKECDKLAGDLYVEDIIVNVIVVYNKI